MALNIAVPMSGVGDLLEGFGLLSPISPVSIDFRSSIKNPLSPVGSESSGVSSLDLEDIKKQMPTLMDENEESDGSSSGPEKSPSNTTVGSTMSSATSSRTCSTSSSSSTASDDYSNQTDENDQKSSDDSSSNDEDGTAAVATPSLTSTDLLGSSAMETEKEPVVTGIDETSRFAEEVKRPMGAIQSNEPNELLLFSPKVAKEPIFSVPRTYICYTNRDILDLASNIRPQGNAPGGFAFQFAELPETNNIQFFLQNRSQYHRLGPNGHVQEFRMATCACCDFQYPVNTVGNNSYAAAAVPSAANQSFGTSNLANLSANQIYGNLQQQQQQQQHQQQMRLQQQQLQIQYANRYNNNANGNSMGRDYNMYHQQAASGMGGGGGLQSSRFNNSVYGSANVLPGGGSMPNAHSILGGSSAANGGFFNNNLLQGRDQYNPMASGMGMQYSNASATPKGISQSNGTLSQPAGQLRQQQQYDMFQQQKQYLNNYAGLGSAAGGNNGVNVTASSNAVAVRLQQQQQSQQASHYYKKPQTMRYGGAGVNNNMPSASGGPATGSNWKSPMSNNNTMPDPATKLFMELNKMQQQQQSQYYVPFQ